MNLELKKAIDQISKDKGLDRDMLIDTLEDAVRTSVLRRFSEDMDVEVTYNDDTGDIEVYQFKIVVEDDDVANEDTQIALADAREHDPSVQLDDEMGFRVKVEDLGRIAAQSAKQVIIQRMRDAEQELIYEEFKDRVGEIVSGIIQRRDKGGWVVNLGRTEAILPREEQIPREHYKRGDRVQALIIEVRKEGRGPQVVISRAHRDYMAALFRREVPEVDDGVVQIMGVARDPGSRAKVAVLSRERDVDPVGACVGMKGSRIYSIVKELRNENIDVVNYTANPTLMIQRSLNPAKVSSITIDEEKMTASVYLKPDQVSLAIGKGGLNIRLSKMLTGYDIDVYREVEEEDVALTEFADEIDGWIIDALKNVGCDTAKSVLELPVEEIAARADLELEQAQKVVEILKAEFEE